MVIGLAILMLICSILICFDKLKKIKTELGRLKKKVRREEIEARGETEMQYIVKNCAKEKI